MQKVKGVKVTRKVKTVKRKFCIKKDTHVYYNCYELRSRAIKNKLRAKNNHYNKIFIDMKNNLLNKPSYHTQQQETV